MSNNAITPAAVNEIAKAPIDEITKLSEDVIEATKITDKASEELTHLSNCLSDFAQTHEQYQKKVKHVRNQMRFIASHI